MDRPALDTGYKEKYVSIYSWYNEEEKKIMYNIKLHYKFPSVSYFLGFIRPISSTWRAQHGLTWVNVKWISIQGFKIWSYIPNPDPDLNRIWIHNFFLDEFRKKNVRTTLLPLQQNQKNGCIQKTIQEICSLYLIQFSCRHGSSPVLLLQLLPHMGLFWR